MTGTAAPALSRLIDRRTGVLTEIEHYARPPEWPASFRMTVGHVADTNADGTWPSDRMSTGMGFTGPHSPDDAAADSVTWAAVGEAVERYCGNFVPAGLPRASWEELSRRGEHATDPRELLLYSPRQYATAGFPFEPLTRQLPVRWAAGTDLRTGERTLVPASLVFPNFYATRYPGEPRTNATVYAGIAAGPGRAWAETCALGEIIERDAVEIWWRAGGTPLAVPPERIESLAGELRGTREELEYTVLGIPSRWQVPVVAVVVYDPHLGILAVGTAARPRLIDAARKAAAEAISLRSYSKGLLTPDGGAWQAVRLGLFGAGRLAPYRADRRYAASFASDFSDMNDLCCNSQYYLDPAALATVLRLRHPQRVVPDGALPDLTGDPREAYLHRLAEAGSSPVSVDLTTADVRETGFRVVRVIAPGTYSNAVAAHPFLAGERWRTEPATLGLREGALPDDHPIPPLPHT